MERIYMQKLIDVHCHLLPGIDDGAKNIEETRRLLEMECADGVKYVIVTPHYRKGMFEATEEERYRSFLQAREEAAKFGIKLKLGCEYHRHGEMLDSLSHNLWTRMSGSRYILLEFSSMDAYAAIRNAVYDVVSRNLCPIVAHVERYPCLVEDIDKVAEIIDLGAYIQVNAGCILGEYGRKQKNFCNKLIKYDMIHFVGTDAHDSKDRIPNLGRCAAYLEKKKGSSYVKRVFWNNPAHVIKNEVLGGVG